MQTMPFSSALSGRGKGKSDVLAEVGEGRLAKDGRRRGMGRVYLARLSEARLGPAPRLAPGL